MNKYHFVRSEVWHPSKVSTLQKYSHPLNLSRFLKQNTQPLSVLCVLGILCDRKGKKYYSLEVQSKYLVTEVICVQFYYGINTPNLSWINLISNQHFEKQESYPRLSKKCCWVSDETELELFDERVAVNMVEVGLYYGMLFFSMGSNTKTKSRSVQLEMFWKLCVISA